MKKINLLLMTTLTVFAVLVSSCKKKDDDNNDDGGGPVDPSTIVLEGNITSNKNLSADKKYLIRGKVYVQSPAVLNIPAGTVLFGEKSSQGTLIINRGAQIVANGTATNPIIFTSSAPVGFRNRGDWGGLIILGNSDNNKGTNVTIEGISAASGENGLYGAGSGAAQNTQSSGSLKFVRIEFAGIPLADDNELNSLTLGSVGSGTTLENIMVSYANDDAIEWFGGYSNAKYIITYKTLDDDLDTDLGYSGMVQYGLVIRDPDQADKSGSRVWESSSSSAAAAPTSSPKFANFTVFGPTMYVNNTTSNQIDGNYRAAVEINTSSAVQIHNSIILGFADAVNSSGSASQINNCVFGYFPAGDQALTTNCVLDSLKNIYGSSFAGKSVSPNAPIAGSHPATDNRSLVSNSIIGSDNPTPLLDASSSYKTGAPAVSGFDDTGYYGAFGTSAATGWYWSSGWINFDPMNATY